MKVKIICTILIALLILFCVRYYIVNRTYSQVELDRKNNSLSITTESKISDVSMRGVGVELVYAIEDVVDWYKLPLTNNFILKYKNGKGIMPEKDRYSMFSIGRDVDNNGNPYIVILADHKPNFFDLSGEEGKTTIYYYNYLLSEDNKLDDIELVKKITIDSTTGEDIEY